MTVEIKGLGKVTANKEVIAFIETAIWALADSYSSGELKVLSEYYKEQARDIHKELKSKNYYGA